MNKAKDEVKKMEAQQQKLQVEIAKQEGALDTARDKLRTLTTV